MFRYGFMHRLTFEKGTSKPFQPWILSVFAAFLFSQSTWATPVDPQALERAIENRRNQVAEFAAVSKEAQSRGLRVFLAGGLAASYGDLVKHQLLSEQGQLQTGPKRLAPVLSNIVLPEQDLDLVITRADGKPESENEIKEFKAWLEQHHPRTVDGRSRWDVNGLKTAQGPRPAWIGDSDFARQNNDSLSIGLIELTQPAAGESIIQEGEHVSKTTSKRSVFLEDLAGDKIHFLQSSQHSSTSRAVQGMNPEILGAIRVLTKAFQFDKELNGEDFKAVKKVIDDFRISSVTSGSYVDNWLKTRAKRLVVHAYDPQKAISTLDQLGLRVLLISKYASDPSPGSVTWWLNKAPLSYQSLSNLKAAGGTGKTAGDLGIAKVEHFTSAEAARMISWRFDGIPRAFISRPNQLGEAAAHGPGFYTKTVGSGEWGAGAETLTFKVNPAAREGVDFTIIGGSRTGVLWSNGSFLEVEHPNLGSPTSYQCNNLFRGLAAAPGAAISISTPPPRALQFVHKHPWLTVGTVIGGAPLADRSFGWYMDHEENDGAYEKSPSSQASRELLNRVNSPVKAMQDEARLQLLKLADDPAEVARLNREANPELLAIAIEIWSQHSGDASTQAMVTTLTNADRNITDRAFEKLKARQSDLTNEASLLALGTIVQSDNSTQAAVQDALQLLAMNPSSRATAAIVNGLKSSSFDLVNTSYKLLQGRNIDDSLVVELKKIVKSASRPETAYDALRILGMNSSAETTRFLEEVRQDGNPMIRETAEKELKARSTPK